MSVLNFIVSDIFGNASIFLALIAVVGLIAQRKKLVEIIQGGAKTAIGVVVLTQGNGIIISAIVGLSAAFNALNPASAGTVTEIGSSAFGAMFGAQIGIVMIIAFAINILVARFTKWKTIFLTGHMLYWFPFVFLAAGYDAGLRDTKLLILATVFTALYMVLMPNLLQPFVRQVIGDDSFAIGHPTAGLSIISGFLGKIFGDKSKSTESLNFPKNLAFLKEISITGGIVVGLTYIVMTVLMLVNGVNAATVFGLASTSKIFSYILLQSFTFGAGLTVLLLGVRMVIAEIVPAFKGFSDKLVPGAIPALDCPMLFSFAPNALVIGFITAMITSVITIIITSYLGIFQTVVLPLTITCFFEIGTASIIGNATGGVRGAIIGSAVSGVIMVFLVGFGAPYFMKTINQWLLVFGGQDFSIWGIIAGFFAKLFV